MITLKVKLTRVVYYEKEIEVSAENEEQVEEQAYNMFDGIMDEDYVANMVDDVNIIGIANDFDYDPMMDGDNPRTYGLNNG